MSDKPQYTHRQVDDMLGEIIQLQAQLDAAIEVADRQRERAKEAEFLANERAKALALVRAECAAWRHYNTRRASGHNDGALAVQITVKATDAANALEQP